MFVRNGSHAGRGNAALIQHGGLPWPNPQGADELAGVLSGALELVAAEPKQEALSFALREKPAAYSTSPAESNPTASAIVTEIPEVRNSPAEELFSAACKILGRELAGGQTEAEIVSLLGVTKSQAKEWLGKMVKDGLIEKVKKTKPVQYRTSNTSDRLL